MSSSLEQYFPKATAAECHRFHVAFPKQSKERLESYLKWREENQLDVLVEVRSTLPRDDATDWENSVDRAITHLASKSREVKKNEGVSSSKQTKRVDNAEKQQKNRRRQVRPSLRRKTRPQQDGTPPENMPQIAYSHEGDSGLLKDKTGHRIIQVLPAQIDLCAASADFYTTLFAFYLDHKFDRNSHEKATLLIDVRPGRGWPNSDALQMLGFIRHVARALHQYYPCRLHRCILYPVPRPAVFIWHMVKAFLDPVLVELIVLLPGTASRSSPPPNDHLQEYLEADTLQLLEQTRCDAFQK